MSTTIDVQTFRDGNLVGQRPLTERAREWLREHMPDDAPRLGATYYVELRFCADIIEDLRTNAGLHVA